MNETNIRIDELKRVINRIITLIEIQQKEGQIYPKLITDLKIILEKI